MTSTLREPDVLNAFDVEGTEDEPYLTIPVISRALAQYVGIEASDEAVRARLQELIDDETVARREHGEREAFRALVGPRLAPDVAARSDERRKLLERTEDDEFLPLDDLA